MTLRESPSPTGSPTPLTTSLTRQGDNIDPMLSRTSIYICWWWTFTFWLGRMFRYDAGIRPDYDGPPTEVQVNLAIRFLCFLSKIDLTGLGLPYVWPMDTLYLYQYLNLIEIIWVKLLTIFTPWSIPGNISWSCCDDFLANIDNQAGLYVVRFPNCIVYSWVYNTQKTVKFDFDCFHSLH